jgi:hypothetical protein
MSTLLRRLPRALAPSRQLTSRLTSRATISTIGVIGAGQMGIGIAQVAIQVARKRVLLLDSSQAQIERGSKFISRKGACLACCVVSLADGLGWQEALG